jgi:hypothetical protein
VKKKPTAHSQNILHVDVLYNIKRKKYQTVWTLNKLQKGNIIVILSCFRYSFNFLHRQILLKIFFGTQPESSGWQSRCPIVVFPPSHFPPGKLTIYPFFPPEKWIRFIITLVKDMFDLQIDKRKNKKLSSMNKSCEK